MLVAGAAGVLAAGGVTGLEEGAAEGAMRAEHAATKQADTIPNTPNHFTLTSLLLLVAAVSAAKRETRLAATHGVTSSVRRQWRSSQARVTRAPRCTPRQALPSRPVTDSNTTVGLASDDERAHRRPSFSRARRCAVSSACSSSAKTSGTTPTPSQLVPVIGLIERPQGTASMKPPATS